MVEIPKTTTINMENLKTIIFRGEKHQIRLQNMELVRFGECPFDEDILSVSIDCMYRVDNLEHSCNFSVDLIQGEYIEILGSEVINNSNSMIEAINNQSFLFFEAFCDKLIMFAKDSIKPQFIQTELDSVVMWVRNNSVDLRIKNTNPKDKLPYSAKRNRFSDKETANAWIDSVIKERRLSHARAIN